MMNFLKITFRLLTNLIWFILLLWWIFTDKIDNMSTNDLIMVITVIILSYIDTAKED